ncbi:uncharacterized protein LOC134396825 [Elgaria multicarinata webbii]|uniref:uncharacterized protein LOC134396825 n=1 Tax=Elgaria multicarinata webbii TaxID=159646 RepID=UPI002FCD0225
MELLFRLYALFQMFLSSSSFCSIHHVQPKWGKAHNVPPEQNETLEAPWLVNVYGNGKRCQGVVLSSWWVLTAANCFLLMKPSHIELTGSHGRVSTKTVSQFLTHRGFSSWDTMPNNDLGLVMLGEPLDLRKKDIWPVCVPREHKPYNTQEECRIFTRGQNGEWPLKEIVVNALVSSECATHWPGTTEDWNLCVAREVSNHTDCKVPVGSPVLCHDPASGHWEVMGIVSQSLHNCTAPILAAQLLTHLKWLWEEGAQSPVTSTTAAKSTTAQPSSKQISVIPTTSHTLQTSPIHTQPHVIIIPATTQRTLKALPSPDSMIVPPTERPSPMPETDVNQGVPVHVIVAGPESPKSKREESPFPGPSLALVPPPSKTISMIPSLQHPVRMTLKQCEIELAWKNNSHTYQLNKRAVVTDHRAGCGLRPGFVPKCPSCSEAEMGEFPWIVSLKLSVQHFCAGSILNPWWILTTANCVNLIKNSEALALVQAGLVDISKAMYSGQIHQALTHPNSLEHQGLHNLGLLQLEKPLVFGSHIAPVCLSAKADMIDDFRNCWLPGWTSVKGGPSVLQRHPLDILSISSCNQLGEHLSDAIFCIKAQMGQEGDCKGDVGSPLICPDAQGGAWLQVGVLSSFDEACSSPYVFSSLPHYLPWLESTTKAAGHRYNHAFPWEQRGPAKNLRLLQEPETLLAWISAQLSLPWQVLIVTCENQNCVGSILNRYWVLTTAQCVREADPASTTVFVGLTHPKGQVRGIRVAGIFPYEKISQHTLSSGYNVALLLLQKPVTFDQHVTPMTFSPEESWDSCKVMGLQMLPSGEVQANPNAYQVKVLVPSDCAEERPEVNPATYCIIRNSSSYLPAAAIGEGAALLCHLEAKSTTWSQVGLMSEPFPGSETVVLSSSIVSYVDWMEETSKQAEQLLSLSHARAACGPSSWALILIMSLLGGTELG